MISALVALLALSGAPTLDQKIASVLPSRDEDKWLSTGWRTNLMAARVEAQREGKPLFLWVMNGHPLGCT